MLQMNYEIGQIPEFVSDHEIFLEDNSFSLSNHWDKCSARVEV